LHPGAGIISKHSPDVGPAFDAGRAGRLRQLVAVLLLTTCAPAWAQDRAAPTTGERITVIGVREILGVPAERSLSEDDISAYGLGTIGELLDEVAAETGEDRDEPIFLVNGERVAGLSDVEGYPTETLERIDVLPVGSGVKVGAPVTRRVYNIVLKGRVDTVAARAAVRAATDGGWWAERGDASYTNVRAARRLNVAGGFRHEGRLRESERDIIQPVGSPANLADFRTLRPEVTGFDARLSAADHLADWLQGSVGARIAQSDRDSLLGLVPVSGLAREQERELLTAGFDLSLNADVGSWLLTFLGNYDYDRGKTRTDRLDPGNPLATALSRTAATTRIASGDIVATGPLFRLPAGSLRGTVGGGLGRDSIRSEQNFLGVETDDHFVQRSQNLSAGIEVPIASRENGFLPSLGELTANAELTRTHVSDFGSFTNQTYSLQWQPAVWIRLFGSVTTGKTPPSVSAISDPIIETPGVRYFDPLAGATVDVSEISGGNPELGPQRGEDRRFSVNLKPVPGLALQVFGDYFGTRNRDIISALPPASELILAAFPERFIRAPDGTLTIVDIRPVSFARQDEDRLRYGFNLMLPLGQHGKGKSGGPRLQVNAAHSWLLSSEILVRPGFSAIDLLSSDAIGIGGASRPRHQFDLSMGYADRGLGVRLNAQYRGKSYLNLISGDAEDVLRFSPLTTVNLRAFATGARFGNASWLKGTRASVSVLNLTNDRQEVRDSAGTTPLLYQREYRDPLGRTVELELRKVF
jgi:iron complex outermembrane recepter protein